MSITMDKLAKELKTMMAASDDRKPKPYDAQAEVLRVEDGIAWVHIPGGVQETPARLTMDAKKGDIVNIRVAGGSAWITGNNTSPPTDNTVANQAKETAARAMTVGEMALSDAQRAYIAAESAEADAQRANTAATAAEQSASDANTAANNALAGLGLVESVVDTVNWFAEHKTATTDTTVDQTKTYYIYNPITGSLVEATPTGTENPAQEGWYELTEAISSYVATHVATTDDGLYILSLGNGWRLLVSSGGGNYAAGVFILDPQGNISQATTANGITFNEDKPFYIGDNNASIIFDGDGHITISGNGVTFGSQSLTSVLSQLGASLKSVEYGKGSSPTSHSDITTWSTTTPTWEAGKYIWMRTTTNGLTYTYTCIQGAKGETGDSGEDAAVLRIDSSRGTVFKNNAVSTVLTVTIYVGSDRITNITQLRNRFGSGAYLQWYWLRLDDSDYGIIVASDTKLSNDGFTLTLTPQDVDTKVTFRCELITS